MTVQRLYASFTARPGCEDALELLTRQLVVDVRAETGNEVFAAARLRDTPRRYFVYEQYADTASFDAHINARYVSEFNAAVASLIEEDVTQLTWLEPLET
jgi:quinol monooxygenase YgiN